MKLRIRGYDADASFYLCLLLLLCTFANSCKNAMCCLNDDNDDDDGSQFSYLETQTRK